MSKVQLRICGDVHGKLGGLVRLSKGAEYTLCVGDVGFDYGFLTKNADPARLRCLGGNHDNYTKSSCADCPGEDCPACNGNGYIYSQQSKHFLGDYGTYEVPGFGTIFYVRGAWSIDFQHRKPGVSWWEDEEIPNSTMCKALALYEQTKPDLVVTHTAPVGIIPEIPFERIFGPTIHGSRTEELLQQMYDLHQPKVQVFGHWHVDFCKKLAHPRTGNETTFVCLNELSCLDFPANFKIGDTLPPIMAFERKDD